MRHLVSETGRDAGRDRFKELKPPRRVTEIFPMKERNITDGRAGTEMFGVRKITAPSPLKNFSNKSQFLFCRLNEDFEQMSRHDGRDGGGRVQALAGYRLEAAAFVLHTFSIENSFWNPRKSWQEGGGLNLWQVTVSITQSHLANFLTV